MSEKYSTPPGNGEILDLSDLPENTSTTFNVLEDSSVADAEEYGSNDVTDESANKESDEPSKQLKTALGLAMERPGGTSMAMEQRDFREKQAVLEVPVPWVVPSQIKRHIEDPDYELSQESMQHYHQQYSKLNRLINDESEPGVYAELQGLFSSVQPNSKVGRGIAAGMSEIVLDNYPDPSDLIHGPLQQEEDYHYNNPDEVEKIRRDFAQLPEGSLVKEWGLDETFDDDTRHRSQERLLQILYGDRYQEWKNLNDVNSVTEALRLLEKTG